MNHNTKRITKLYTSHGVKENKRNDHTNNISATRQVNITRAHTHAHTHTHTHRRTHGHHYTNNRQRYPIINTSLTSVHIIEQNTTTRNKQDVHNK